MALQDLKDAVTSNDTEKLIRYSRQLPMRPLGDLPGEDNAYPYQPEKSSSQESAKRSAL
ncbi:MAG: hypothetical protein ACRERD_09980 [Candidatus Binatia bacterium]